MFRSLARSLFASLIVVLLAPIAAGDHKDARLGFTIQTPKDWAGVPTKADERWLVASYVSPKSNFFTEKNGGWTYEHKPNMQTIAFVSEQIKEMAKIKKVKDKEGDTTLILVYDSPYKDYKDFMQQRYSGGGWFVDKEETQKVGDVNVTCYDIRVEKLSYDGPKHIITWIYHVPDVDIAVQFECLEDALPKLKDDFLRCLRSFKTTPRSGEALSRDVSTGHKMNFFEAERLPPDERKNWRVADEREMHERSQKNVPAGWTAKMFGRFLVIFDCDEKFVKTIVTEAEAVWKWLDESFPFIGDKEYVRAPVIRICKNEEEYRQFNKNADWSWNNLEILTYQDFGGTTSSSIDNVNRRMADVWFTERDRDLFSATPTWLQDGLMWVIGKARAEKGKVEFKNDDWNREEVRESVREGRSKKPRELMMIGKEDLYSSSKGFWDIQGQSQALVNFFIAGSAAKNPRTKTVLQDYFKSLKIVQLAIKAEGASKDDAKKPATEEEEDAWFRNQHQGYKQKEQRILDEAFKKTFGSWSDKDWDNFDKVFFKSVVGGSK